MEKRIGCRPALRCHACEFVATYRLNCRVWRNLGRMPVFAKVSCLTSGESDIRLTTDTEVTRSSVKPGAAARRPLRRRSPFYRAHLVQVAFRPERQLCGPGLQPPHPRQGQTGRKAGAQSQGPAGNICRKPGCRKGEAERSLRRRSAKFSGLNRSASAVWSGRPRGTLPSGPPR